jgi:hypothetical protein
LAWNFTDRDIVSRCVVHDLSASGSESESVSILPAPLAIDRIAVAFRNVQGVSIQLLMPESHGCPLDSDFDPESCDIHAE